MCPYWWKGTQNFDPILGCEGVRRVQGGEVGQSSWWISWCPAQDVTQLRRVGINRVPRHQELQTEQEKVRNLANLYGAASLAATLSTACFIGSISQHRV